MKNIFLLSLALMMSSNISCSSVKIVAHRGASHDAPENTMVAYRLAWEQDADAIEGDFYLTSDGKVAVIHDPTTKRTTSVNWKVEEHTLTELVALDAGSWKDAKWSGERLPDVDAVLACVPRRGKIFIEIKDGKQTVPAMREAIKRSRLNVWQVVIISFKEEVIAEVKRTMPYVRAYWLFAFKKDEKTGEWNATHDEVVRRARKVNADGVDLQANERVNEELAAKLHSAQLELHVWTVDDPDVARRMIELGAKSITTNRPGWLREELKKKD